MNSSRVNQLETRMYKMYIIKIKLDVTPVMWGSVQICFFFWLAKMT